MRPCGKSGNRFILSVIDFASHFPLAYPLQSHSAYEVVKCLIRAFTRFEVPNELPSECGTEFMSELMQVFCLSIGCGIWNLALTIHNQMGVWSDFTARESLWSMVLVSRFLAIGRVSTMGTVRLQGSTGRRFDFCSVRFGFRSQHEGSTSVDNEIKAERWDIGFIFFLDLRERIKTSMEIVIGHTAKKKSKGWFDKKFKKATYEEVEQVLWLLPLMGKPLQAKYCMPHVIEKRLREVDCAVKTHDRRKSRMIVHVNLLKRYVPRSTDNLAHVTHEDDQVDDLQVYPPSLSDHAFIKVILPSGGST